MKLHVQGRHLADEQGKLFFYTADTAWELFHKLSVEEAHRFIDDRARKGFNVIQAVAVAELDGLHTPAVANGSVPFSNLDTLTPNEEYFKHVREVISYANQKGVFIALVPMWGSYFVPNPEWGGKVQTIFDAQKAYTFVKYLAKKVRDLDVIWILGGDRPYLDESAKAVVTGMARAVREICGHDQLLTSHTQGGRSIWDMVGKEGFLDFITWQTGHMGQCYPAWRSIALDYERQELPVLDAEPCYESHPIMNEHQFTRRDAASRFTDFNVRRSSWWSVFSGGAGITYGCYAIWQMRNPQDETREIPESAASSYAGDNIPYWYDCLDFPGAFQICRLRRFMEALPHPLDVIPDQSLILSDNPTGEGHLAAITNKQHEFIAVYVPCQSHLCIDLSIFEGAGFTIKWFDPRYGIMNFLSKNSSETKFLNLTSPLDGQDYVLYLTKN